MPLPATFSARFSPYHDDDPVTDFFEDSAQRITSIIALVFAVHVGLYFTLSSNFIVPDLIADEPEPIPVQIIAFEDLPQPLEATPPPADITPAIPIQAPPPRVKPTPPPPAPEPEIITEPEPKPDPEPIPEPEPVFVPPPEPEPVLDVEPIPEPEPAPPPPPEIIAQELVDPAPEAIPAPEPVPLPEPDIEVLPEIEPLPIIPEPEIIPEPLIPDPVIPEPIPTPITPDPIPEPITERPQIEMSEPDIIEEILPDAITQPPLDTPILTEELAPLITPDPVDIPPAPGPVIDAPLPEDILPEAAPVLPEPIIEPEPDLEPIIEPAIPDIQPPTIEVPEPAPAIVTTAPTILASPDAPTSSQEIETAIPQSQSDPFLDLLKKDTQNRPDPSGRINNPALSGPRSGGGNLGLPPPSGGTRRAGPSGGNWQLAPNSYGQSGETGYEGINLDIRCREADRTHKDCPEYIRKFEGRDAQGFERWQGRAGRGTNAGSNLRPQGRILPTAQSLGVPNLVGSSINGLGSVESFNAQGGEFSLQTEQPFSSRQAPSQPQGRLRDLIINPPNSETGTNIETNTSAAPLRLPEFNKIPNTPPNETDSPDPNAWILKKPRE